MRSSLKLAVGAALMAVLGAGAAGAQTAYPTKPIEVVVGYAAGGPVDILARQVAPFLEKHLGNGASIAVINRPGASGVLAAADVARAAPDGHTLLMFSHPALFTTLFGQAEQPYDVTSFDYLGTITAGPHNLFVAKDSPFQDLGDLVEATKADPGGVTIGGAGIGTAAHLAAKLVEAEAGLQFNYIPAAGASESVSQVLGGHIQGGFTSVSGTLSLYRDGEVRILGVLADERAPSLPDVPTFKEQGIDVQWGAVRGLAGPAGMPADVVEKLSDALAATMQDPEFLAAAEKQGLALEYRDGKAFRALADRQIGMLQNIWETNPWQ